MNLSLFSSKCSYGVSWTENKYFSVHIVHICILRQQHVTEFCTSELQKYLFGPSPAQLIQMLHRIMPAFNLTLNPNIIWKRLFVFKIKKLGGIKNSMFSLMIFKESVFGVYYLTNESSSAAGPWNIRWCLLKFFLDAIQVDDISEPITSGCLIAWRI